jgi:glycosyltransferase involved in cell wall biosynthesis
MHIVFWSPGWPLEKFHNGIVTYVHWMKRELEGQGHRVSVLTSNLDGSLRDPDVHRVSRSRLNGALRRILRGGKKPRFEVFEVAADIAESVKRLHRRHPVDVIEMEESFGWFADVARRTMLPTVVKLHGPAFLSMIGEELETPFGKEKIEREGRALRSAPAIISPCNSTLEDTISRYALEPQLQRRIVNPMTLASGTPLWSLETCDRGTILFVGRFDRRKGGDIVLQAFARLLRSGRRCRLIFVGPDVGIEQSDGDRLHFEAYRDAVLPPESRYLVEFRGRLANRDIAALRVQAMVTLVASRWENQGYTLLEAMLQGCPVVSSDAGGCPESVIDDKTGLLARSEDPDSFADKLGSMLANPQRAAELGRSARRHVEALHSAATVASDSLEVYRELIAVQSARASALK